MKTVNCYDYCTTDDKKFICMANDMLELQSSMERGIYEFAYSVLSGDGFEQYKSLSNKEVEEQYDAISDSIDFEVVISIAENLKDNLITPLLYQDRAMQSMFEDLVNKQPFVKSERRIKNARQEVARRFGEYDNE